MVSMGEGRYRRRQVWEKAGVGEGRCGRQGAEGKYG